MQQLTCKTVRKVFLSVAISHIAQATVSSIFDLLLWSQFLSHEPSNGSSKFELFLGSIDNHMLGEGNPLNSPFTKVA